MTHPHTDSGAVRRWPHRRDQQFWRNEALRTGLNRTERRRLRLYRWKPMTGSPLGGVQVVPTKSA